MLKKLIEARAITAFTLCTCSCLLSTPFLDANNLQFDKSDEFVLNEEQDLFKEDQAVSFDVDDNDWDDGYIEEENDSSNEVVEVDSNDWDSEYFEEDAFLDLEVTDAKMESDDTSNLTPQSSTSSKQATLPSRNTSVSCPPLDGEPIVGGYGIYLTASGLAWKVKEDGLAYVIKNHTPINNGASQVPYPNHDAQVKHFDFDWAGGFRLGAGGHFAKRRWDLSLDWTWYQQDTHTSAHANGNEELFAVWMSPVAPLNNSFSTCYRAKASWNMHYNILDLDLGRYCAVSRFFSVRPHLGIRSAWIDQKFDVDYHDFPGIGAQLGLDKVAIDLKNNFWGWGIRAGLDTNWTLWRCWSLFGNAAFALLQGNFQLSNKETDYPIGAPVIHQVNLKESYHSVRGNLECAIGVRWDYRFHKDRCHLAVTIGWEELFWFNQNQINQLANADFTGLVKAHGDLALTGITANVQFDF